MILSLDRRAISSKKRPVGAGEGDIGFCDRGLRGSVDQQTQRKVQIVVAGRALDRPIGAQALVRGQDLSTTR